MVVVALWGLVFLPFFPVMSLLLFGFAAIGVVLNSIEPVLTAPGKVLVAVNKVTSRKSRNAGGWPRVARRDWKAWPRLRYWLMIGLFAITIIIICAIIAALLAIGYVKAGGVI